MNTISQKSESPQKNWLATHLVSIASVTLLLGIFCFIGKAISPEYLDAEGFLHERFFLLPLGYLFVLAGVLLLLLAGVRRFRKNFQQ